MKTAARFFKFSRRGLGSKIIWLLFHHWSCACAMSWLLWHHAVQGFAAPGHAQTRCSGDPTARMTLVVLQRFRLGGMTAGQNASRTLRRSLAEDLIAAAAAQGVAPLG